MRLQRGTVLEGTTTEHSGKIEIIKATPRNYEIRVPGGQHDGKSERFLPRYVVERFYKVVSRPKR